MPSVGSILGNALAPQPPARPPAVAPKAMPVTPGGRMAPDTALFRYHQQRKANSRQLTIPMAEAARHFDLQPTPANMQAWGAWFNQCDRPGVLGPKTFVFSATASMQKESPNPQPDLVRLQQNLARRGYGVAATGTFDAATERAIVAFKRAQGLHDGFRAADGQPAYLPFADERVQAALSR